MKLETINEQFGKYAQLLLRFRWAALALFAAVLVLSFMGMQRMVKETSFDDYFIEGDPMLVMTDEFKAHFGNDYYIGVLTKCPNIFEHKALTTLRALSNELADSLSYAEKVTSLTNIEFMVGDEWGMTIEQIVPDAIPADGSAAMDSVRARAYSKPHVARKLVSADGTLSWILVKLRPFPADSVWKQESSVSPDMQTGQEVHRILCKPEYATLHPKGTGMPYVSARKNDFIGLEMGRLMLSSIVICLVVMLLMTASLRGMVAPLISVAGGLFITYGIAGATQMYVDSTVLMVPTILAFAVSIAYNIHIFSYFRGRMRLHGIRRQALIESLSEIGWSMSFCGLTTIVSLLSFLVIPIRPMQCTGIICSMSVLFVLLTTLFVTPVLLSFGKDKPVRPGVTVDSDTWFSAWLVRVGDFTLRYSKMVSGIFVVVCVALCFGLVRIVPSFDIEQTMGSKVPYVKDVVEVGRSELGSLYSYDLVVEFPDDDAAKQPENLHSLEMLINHIELYPLTKRTTSILNILKDLNQTLNNGDSACYRIPNTEEEVAQMMLLYENAGGSEAEYWTDYEYRRLRIMVEISDYNSAEVEKELADLHNFAVQMFPNARIQAVGNIPQYTTMMQYLVRGQMQSFVISILIIGLIMMVAFQSVRIGLIGLIPNLMPAVFVGGYMGWAGIPLDMMTATLLPMMLGLAVDDTIHFINHSKLEYDRLDGQYPGQWRLQYLLTTRRTFRVVGVAIVTTSIIASAVFSSFVTSTCNMCINFGLLAIIGILSALLADVFITPILINKCKVFGADVAATKDGKGFFAKKNDITALLAILLLGSSVPSALAQNKSSNELSGRDVMQLVKDRPDGDTRSSDMEMTLCKKNGKTRLRKLSSWAMDEGKDCKKVMFFTYPGDVKGTGFLVWDYDLPEKDDDKWLYLPAMKKTRRISGSSSKADYFMGTDFTYGDMGSRNVDEDAHVLLREEKREGVLCWVVQSTPFDKREIYGHKISWIRQDCHIAAYVEYYDKLGALQRVLTTSEIRKVQGFWTVHRMEMKNVQTGHSTLLVIKNPAYEVKIDKTLFTVNKLEQGL